MTKVDSYYDIKPEWKVAWQWASGVLSSMLLAQFIVHLLAGWMKERFAREHALTFQGMCCGCRFLNGGTSDPCHRFNDADWRRLAREGLSSKE